MFFVCGWGKVTKKAIGVTSEKTCNYCNRTEVWQLCKNRSWFTLFFIPVIPYNTTYSIACPNCGSYIEISDEQFHAMKANLDSAYKTDNISVEDSIKYAGKNAVQINYLKQMEEFNNKK